MRSRDYTNRIFCRHPTITLAYKTNGNSQVKRRGASHVRLVNLVWIMRDGSLNQGKLRLPMMGWSIKSRGSR